jgi:THO complex subunit 5
LARLEWELTQRKQLATLCDELTESKKAVASNIETKQTRLDNLAPQLRTILTVKIYFKEMYKIY